jgi:hypothetical protein
MDATDNEWHGMGPGTAFSFPPKIRNLKFPSVPLKTTPGFG